MNPSLANTLGFTILPDKWQGPSNALTGKAHTGIKTLRREPLRRDSLSSRHCAFAERLGYELPFVFVDHVAWSVCSDFLHVDTVAFEDVDHLPDAGNVLGRASLEPADAETKLVTSE